MIVSEMVAVRLSGFKLRGKNPSKKDLSLTVWRIPKYVQVGITVLVVALQEPKIALQTCPTL